MITNPLDYITDKALSRRDKFQTREVDKLIEYKDLSQHTILGTYSQTLMETKERLIWIPSAIPVMKRNVSAEGEIIEAETLETPSAIARDYLTWRYKKSPNARHTQIVALRSIMRSPPNYSHLCKFEDGYYLDLESAYWSILNIVGWNLDYWPGKWLGVGEAPHDYPFKEYKKSRLLLVSVCIGNEIPVYHPDIQPPKHPIQMVKTPNHLQNIQLWGLVTDVLNAIAGQAINLGAVYVATDGYIAPDKKSCDKITQMILDWGLTCKIKHSGRGEVFGPGSYRIGKHQTVNTWELSEDHEGVRIPRYHRWLQKQVEYWSARNAA